MPIPYEHYTVHTSDGFALALYRSRPRRSRSADGLRRPPVLLIPGFSSNRFTFGAYRAPGAPTAAFAVESLLDELAGRLEIDPVELRLRNAVREGDVGVSARPFPVIGADARTRIHDHQRHSPTGRLFPAVGGDHFGANHDVAVLG